MLDKLENDGHTTVGELDKCDEFRDLADKDPTVKGLRRAIEDSLYNIITKCQSVIAAKKFSNQDALFLMIQYQSLESSTNILSSYQPQTSSLKSLVSTVCTWLKNTFFPLIKNIGNKLLSILSTLATPKEWTIKGKTSLLGLSNIELEIKFGP